MSQSLTLADWENRLSRLKELSSDVVEDICALLQEDDDFKEIFHKDKKDNKKLIAKVLYDYTNDKDKDGYNDEQREIIDKLLEIIFDCLDLVVKKDSLNDQIKGLQENIKTQVEDFEEYVKNTLENTLSPDQTDEYNTVRTESKRKKETKNNEKKKTDCLKKYMDGLRIAYMEGKVEDYIQRCRKHEDNLAGYVESFCEGKGIGSIHEYAEDISDDERKEIDKGLETTIKDFFDAEDRLEQSYLKSASETNGNRNTAKKGKSREKARA